MKMTIVLALALSAAVFAAAKEIEKSPELVPRAVWAKLPAMAEDAKLSDEDLRAMERIANKDLDRSAPLRAHPVVRMRISTAPMLLAQAHRIPPAPAAAPDAPIPPAEVESQQQTVEAIQREVAAAQNQAVRAADDARKEYERALTLNSAHPFKLAMGGNEGRNLIIRTGDADPKSLATAEEDLTVMSRILAKAVPKAGDDEDKKVMGIRLTGFGSGVKNLLIEGYGAVFLLKVNIPLAGPPAKVAEERPKEAANSTWEETREELYGSREASKRPRATHAAPGLEYDPKRVEDLENALLEALKNAGNIRALKDNESATIVVTSGDNNTSAWVWDQPMAFNGSSGGGGSYSWSYSSDSSSASASASSQSSRAGSTLTIRAKKPDIDAFLKGKLNLDEFRRKATVTVY